VPLDVVRWSAQTLEQAAVVGQHGHRAAGSDIGVAVALLKAGAAGARLNVETNIESVKNPTYADGVRDELRHQTETLERASAAVSAILS
jgi:formiminotetrahydrofolate cyclodeaminase